MNKTSVKKPAIRKIVNCISGLTCLVLASCSGTANFTDGEVLKRNEVEMIRLAFAITFEADNTSLPDSEIQRLDMFMMKSNVSYGDELSMDFPLNRDGSLSRKNQERMAFLSELLKKRGLHLSPEVTPYGMTPGENQARFLISRYVVTPPQCGDWSQPSTDNYGNTSMRNLGCATQAQLGLMVANPRDLITGVTNPVPDTEKAAKAIFTYRTKTPTAYSGAKSGKKK